MADPIAKLIDAVMHAHRDDIQQLTSSKPHPADPMRPTVVVPRDLVEAIVDDVREGLALERETADQLAELLESGAA